MVTKVDHNPSWIPTPGIVRRAREQGIYLKSSYGPNDPDNPMGAVKLIINFTGRPELRYVRIHGAAEEDDLGRHLSNGCIRMRNPDILAMVRSFEGRLPRVHFFT
ncbi:L,D-transpeptidase family protein [Patescibacteria group bacterium]|nr:L,D-transpeptidase family protein [Patescibacteria group bacterium]